MGNVNAKVNFKQSYPFGSNLCTKYRAGQVVDWNGSTYNDNNNINCEAIQARADAQCQNSFCGKPVVLKTTQTFLKPSSELY